uniref:Uncharacterized protein n=1 Tax=Acrobeloides nanus TaxID=290746 RepID=A0A914D8S2_9BILA
MSFQLNEFLSLSKKIYTNNENEKNRLKTLKDNFVKSEKSIHQAAKKGQKSKSEVSDFYKREMDNVVSQQAKRYLFIAEKHKDLTKSYADLFKLIVNLWSVEIEHEREKVEENHIDASPRIKHKAEKSSSIVEQDERRNDSLPSSEKQDSAVFNSPKVFDLEAPIQQDEDPTSNHHIQENSAVSAEVDDVDLIQLDVS